MADSTEIAASIPRSFCVAPWLESVLYNDGSYRICSRNSRVFGDWREQPLEKIWKGKELREFRKSIVKGEYPDQDCEACHKAGTYQKFSRILGAPYEAALRRLSESEVVSRGEFDSLRELGKLLDDPAGPEEILTSVEKVLALVGERVKGDAEASLGLQVPSTTVRILRAYRAGDPAPPVVGPFRQVQLIAKCNARCVMCPGNFTGELENGSTLEEKFIPAALAHPQDVVDFFCNGSEFLLFKGWKEIAAKLKAGGCGSLRVSTNGMLLTPDNGRYLIDQGLIGHMNVSLNSAKPETLERVQKNVRFPRLISNIETFLDYAKEKNAYFPMSFSFILLRSTLAELPEYIRLIHRFSQRCSRLKPHAMIMSLENAGLSDYRTFLFEEHPDFIPPAERAVILAEAATLAEELGVETALYNFGPVNTLRELVNQGPIIPPFVPLPVDLESIEARARECLDPIYDEVLASGKKEIDRIYAEVMAKDQPYPFGNELVVADRLPEALLPELFARLQARLAAGPPPVFRFLFPRQKDYAARFAEYSAEYVGHLLRRLPDRLEIHHRELFASFFGSDRHHLADHFGRKHAPVPLEKVRTGTFVITKNFREYKMVGLSEAEITLESPHTLDVRQLPRDQVQGVFLLDVRPETALAADPLPVAEGSLLGKTLSGAEEVPEGAQLLGGEFHAWTFLLAKGSVVYLVPRGRKDLCVYPREMLKGAFVQELGPLPPELRSAKRKAALHWAFNEKKRRLIGETKSPALWQLSRLYRFGLKFAGFKMPTDLVIADQKSLVANFSRSAGKSGAIQE